MESRIWNPTTLIIKLTVQGTDRIPFQIGIWNVIITSEYHFYSSYDILDRYTILEIPQNLEPQFSVHRTLILDSINEFGIRASFEISLLTVK